MPDFRDIDITIPTPPPNLTIIENEFQPGFYIVGHDEFSLGTFPLTNVFHRELTNVDDFFLGVLSVILIAILSDMTQTILLRGTSNRVSLSGMFTAFLVDEATHMRNIARLLRRARHISESRALAPPIVISAIVLTIVLLLFIADVVIVVVTQPRAVASGPFHYNIRGLHPTLTNDNLAKWVFRMTANRPCIAPSMVNGSNTQSRSYHLNACILRSEKASEAFLDRDDPATVYSINMTSLYHIAGSDHNISFADSWVSVSVRVQAILDGSHGGTRYVLFDMSDDEQLTNIRYLHTRTMAQAKAFACSRKNAPTLCSDKNVKKITQPSKHWPLSREMAVWKAKKGYKMAKARGVTTIFSEPMPLPYHSFNTAMRVLATSGTIREVSGKGFYGNTRNDTITHSGEGLLKEDSRVGGVVLLTVLTGVALVIMLGLRFWLQPTSLSCLAAESVDKSFRSRSIPNESDSAIPRTFDPAASFGLRPFVGEANESNETSQHRNDGGSSSQNDKEAEQWAEWDERERNMEAASRVLSPRPTNSADLSSASFL